MKIAGRIFLGLSALATIQALTGMLAIGIVGTIVASLALRPKETLAILVSLSLLSAFNQFPLVGLTTLICILLAGSRTKG